MVKNKYIYVCPLDIKGENAYGGKIQGYGTFCVFVNGIDSIDMLQKECNNLMSESEKQYLKCNKHDRRKESFLLGRVTAKYAYEKYYNLYNRNEKFDYKNVCVVASSTGKPILKYMSINSNCQLTITHSNNIGISFVYDSCFLFGIDLEVCTTNSIKSAEEMLSVSEKEMIILANNVRLCLLFWSAKESLGKYLGIGLSAEYSFFEIGKVHKEREIYYISFVNFSRHKVIGLCYDDFVITLAYYDGIILETLEQKLLQIGKFISIKRY